MRNLRTSSCLHGQRPHDQTGKPSTNKEALMNTTMIPRHDTMSTVHEASQSNQRALGARGGTRMPPLRSTGWETVGHPSSEEAA